MAAKPQLPMGYQSSKICCRQTKFVDLWRTSTQTKKTLGENPLSKWVWQNGRQSAESLSPRFECLNMLGFQRNLARVSGLAIRQTLFCLAVLKTVSEMAAKHQVPMGYQSSKICRRQTRFGRVVKDIKTNEKTHLGQNM